MLIEDIWGGERRGSSCGIGQLQPTCKIMYSWGGLGLESDQVEEISSSVPISFIKSAQ